MPAFSIDYFFMVATCNMLLFDLEGDFAHLRLRMLLFCDVLCVSEWRRGQFLTSLKIGQLSKPAFLFI